MDRHILVITSTHLFQIYCFLLDMLVDLNSMFFIKHSQLFLIAVYTPREIIYELLGVSVHHEYHGTNYWKFFCLYNMNNLFRVTKLFAYSL